MEWGLNDLSRPLSSVLHGPESQPQAWTTPYYHPNKSFFSKNVYFRFTIGNFFSLTEAGRQQLSFFIFNIEYLYPRGFVGCSLWPRMQYFVIWKVWNLGMNTENDGSLDRYFQSMNTWPSWLLPFELLSLSIFWTFIS